MTSTVHGIERTDDYAWLRADNWQQVMHEPEALPAEIRAYLEAENAHAAAAMADVEDLRLALFAEMRGRIKEDDSSVPAPDGPYAYGVRYVEGAEHPMLVRTAREGGSETILLDANALAADKAYFRLGGGTHSPDHRRLAYSVDDKGSEYFTIHVRDIETGTDLADAIPGTTGNAVWAADGRTLFYVWVDENHRPAKVLRHTVGTDTADDVVVFEDPHPGFFIGIGKSQSNEILFIESHDHETSEVHILEADDPTGTPRLVAARRKAEEYHADHGGDRLYILTNANGAEDFKIVSAPVATPDRRHWRNLVPHRAGRLILHLSVYKDYLVRLERENGLARIVVRHLSSGNEHEIALHQQLIHCVKIYMYQSQHHDDAAFCSIS